MKSSKRTRRARNLLDLQQEMKAIQQPLARFFSLTLKEKEVLYQTVKLNEEVGELCNDILAVLTLQRKAKLKLFDKRNLYEEFADVLITTAQLANVMGVNLDRAVKDKLRKIKQRTTSQSE